MGKVWLVGPVNGSYEVWWYDSRLIKGDPVGWTKLEQISGPEGPQGPFGMQGYQGEPGPRTTIKGTVPFVMDLSSIEDPQPGDGWIIGETGELWVYS